MDRGDVIVATTHAPDDRALPGLLARQLEAEGFVVWRDRLSDVFRKSRNDHRTPIVILHWIGHLTRRSLVPSMVVTAKLFSLLVLLRWRRGSRVVWYLHNDQAHEPRHRWLERGIQRVLATWLADRVVVMSPEGFDLLEQFGRSARARGRLVPQPSYEATARPLPDRASGRVSLGLDPRDKVLLLFGRIRPYKGVPDLLQAVRGITDRDLRVLVAGLCTDPALAREIERLAALDDRIIVRFGSVPDEDVPTLFAATDWAVLPYRRILNSAVALLSVTYGVPVIAPALGALPYSLCDDGVAGILYEPGPLALQAAVERALDTTDEDRATMVSVAARIRSRVSIESVGRTLAAVLDEAVAQRPKRTLLQYALRRKISTTSR